MTDLEWSPVVVRLGDLSHWAENPVTLSKAQAKKLLKSTERLGRMQTLAIGPQNGDGKHPLYDGHQRVNVWGAAFGMELQVNALQSSRPLTDEERHQVPIMLRTATGSLDWDALAGWDAGSLMEWGFDSDMLDGWKRDIAALGNLIESETPEPQDAEPQIDRAEELQEKWQVKAGDLWRIGEHRLLCGDSTRRENAERVMQGDKVSIVTDPPYGIDVDTSWLSALNVKRGKPPNKSDDKLQGDDGTLDLSWLYQYDEWLVFGFPFVARTEKYTGLLVWDKRSDGGEGGLGNPIEVAASNAFNGYRLARHVWAGYVREAGEKREAHPTQKPIGIIVDAVRLVKNACIFDPFVGSGTTIVACQNLGRKCRAIEISPAYCAVTLERMSTAFPALTIERI